MVGQFRRRVSRRARYEHRLEPREVRPRRRGIMLLPNLFTTAALFSGFVAIVQAMDHQFEYAAKAIFLAMILDGMDGRVARLTNTQSPFGEQYDSLSDMTSFGVAPALVVYEWCLNQLGRLGGAAAFLYCACAALRLARFNANIGVVDRRFFQGLPSPAAAALIAGFVWLTEDQHFAALRASGALPWVVLGLAIYAGLSMVSNVPFYSGKSFHLKRSVPFWFFIIVIIGLFLLASNPPVATFCLFCCYAGSGYGLFVYRWFGGDKKAVTSVTE